MPRQATIPTVATLTRPVVKAKDRDPVAAGTRDAAVNRSAGHNYFLTDRVEAGVALRGTEVKSIREGKANLKDAYGLLKDGEAFLLNAHIGPFSHGNLMNHDALRTRKLLLHRNDVNVLFEHRKQYDDVLPRERESMRELFAAIEDAVAGIASGAQDEMIERFEGDEAELELIKAWGARWAKVWRRKAAVEEAQVGDDALPPLGEPPAPVPAPELEMPEVEEDMDQVA